MNKGSGESFQTIHPNEAGHYSGGYPLSEWYHALQPGKYYLTVKRRAAGEAFSLVSNRIAFEILPDRSF
jgi:hypothetical protein